MIVDDPLLPSAPHLMGPDAADLLRAAVAAADGELRESRMVQVQYRPGSDLVVRFEALVSWGGGPWKPETLLAGVTTEGAFPGTLPMEAGDVVAGVWRYPFDPRVPGLAAAVTPGALSRRLGGIVPGIDHVEVRAYRPIRRAVVHVRGAGGEEVYVKVVRPSDAGAIVRRHRELAAAGVPVPEVLDADLDLGLLVLAALPGQSLRDRLLEGTTDWPAPAQHRELATAIARVPVTGPATFPDIAHATASHASAIAAVLPRQRPALDRIVDAVSTLRPTDPNEAVTIHGDLYEAQLMVQGDRITGLLDLDDVGPGHPLDDPATLLAHLHILRPGTRSHHARLVAHRARLREALGHGHDVADLDLRTAGVLVGLATGPFRAQSDAWRDEVRRRLRMASRLVARGARRRATDERSLRSASSEDHRRPSSSVA